MDEYTVISTNPEGDAIGRILRFAKENDDENPGIIGWGFLKLSQEQKAHRYAAIHIDRLFDNPFVTIPGAYGTLNDFMRTNGLIHVENEVIPCFETNGEGMGIYCLQVNCFFKNPANFASPLYTRNPKLPPRTHRPFRRKAPVIK